MMAMAMPDGDDGNGDDSNDGDMMVVVVVELRTGCKAVTKTLFLCLRPPSLAWLRLRWSLMRSSCP